MKKDFGNIDKISEEKRWQRIYKKGKRTVRNFRIVSEDYIDRILHNT